MKNKTAIEIRSDDTHKIENAEKHGYDVLVVWESDFINNNERILDECRRFINM